jgi:hypothetical protein
VYSSSVYMTNIHILNHTWNVKTKIEVITKCKKQISNKSELKV